MSEGWHEFFFMVGSTAGALIGLLFVVITLGGNLDPHLRTVGARIYVTPTVVHFASVLFISALALMPDLSEAALGLLLLIPAAGGLFYVAVVIRRFFGSLPDRPHWTDPIFYAALPTVGYAALTIAAVAFWLSWPFAPYVLVSGLLGLLFLGIRDAWDTAVWLSTQHGQDH